MKSLFPRSLPVFRECVNSRAYGSLGKHPFFFRKPVVTAGLFNGVEKSETPKGIITKKVIVTIKSHRGFFGGEQGEAVPDSIPFKEHFFLLCYFLCLPKGSNQGKGTPVKSLFPRAFQWGLYIKGIMLCIINSLQYNSSWILGDGQTSESTIIAD
ncbi:hypothetical protein LLG96_14775 [bacterium]|nr:hypothetical protein [bacterium]